ncbi:putative F-box protein At5g55150 [Rhododendron vialii]|uniref:putative F-box protein At5g55150 n=1 Tax=Rhododendron vialii TaxID=182163 RepID=UPI00265E75F4|nr:putative F-box protein At5g55150 [Rhododendron vialii]
MGNWAELLEDLLVGIAKQIPALEDFVAFGGVCRSWRLVAIKHNFKGSQQTPWLMLSEQEGEENTSERRIVSLTKGGMVRKLALPGARGKRCFESLGWFITVSEHGEMELLHPFSQAQIPLPHINTFKYYVKNGSMEDNFIFIRKAVLSYSPDDALGNKDHVVMVIYGGRGWLGFWRPGYKAWTTIETRLAAFYDIVYYNGRFYGADAAGSIFACDVGGPNETVARFVGKIPHKFLIDKRPYIVASEAGLLMVVRDGCLAGYGDDPDFDCDNMDESRIDYGAKEFTLFAVDLNNGGWTEKKSLGDKALFLGDNASISVQASEFLRIKANCIYYTDDCWEAYKSFKPGGGKDMGIYNLEDGSRMPYYGRESFSSICPPIWVNPSF